MDFNGIISKTKEVLGVAADKTTEVVNIGKKKYDIASLEHELEKLYNKLGKASFEKLADREDVDGDIKAAINDVKAKKQEIETAKKELLKAQSKRVCPKCGETIEENAAFCSACGEKLVFTEEKAEEKTEENNG